MKSSKTELLKLKTSKTTQQFLIKEAKRFKTTPEKMALFFLAKGR